MKKTVLVSCVLVVLLLSSLSVFAADSTFLDQNYEEDTQELDYAPGGIIILFNYGTSSEEVDKMIDTYDLELIYRYSIINGAFVGVPVGEELNLIDKLSELSIVSSAKLNGIIRLH